MLRACCCRLGLVTKGTFRTRRAGVLCGIMPQEHCAKMERSCSLRHRCVPAAARCPPPMGRGVAFLCRRLLLHSHAVKAANNGKPPVIHERAVTDHGKEHNPRRHVWTRTGRLAVSGAHSGRDHVAILRQNAAAATGSQQHRAPVGSSCEGARLL